jgi:hypothetical protein
MLQRRSRARAARNFTRCLAAQPLDAPRVKVVALFMLFAYVLSTGRGTKIGGRVVVQILIGFQA